MTANLSDKEIDDICSGLTQNSAKVRHLERLGLSVHQKPNGRPLISRSHYEVVMSLGMSSSQASNARNGPKWGVH
jgi:hypothetical protein